MVMTTLPSAGAGSAKKTASATALRKLLISPPGDAKRRGPRTHFKPTKLAVRFHRIVIAGASGVAATRSRAESVPKALLVYVCAARPTGTSNFRGGTENESHTASSCR